MATQICPKCNEDTFTWRMGDDEPLTIWGCHKCSYTAFENEDASRTCQKCKKEIQLKLKDKQKTYWWCSKCNNIELIQNNKKFK